METLVINQSAGTVIYATNSDLKEVLRTIPAGDREKTVVLAYHPKASGPMAGTVYPFSTYGIADEEPKKWENWVDAAESLGWTVRIGERNRDLDETELYIGQASPAGEDFGLYLCVATDPEHPAFTSTDVADAIREYGFDPDEHATIMSGARGAPSITELVEDAHRIEDMLDELERTLRFNVSDTEN